MELIRKVDQAIEKPSSNEDASNQPALGQFHKQQIGYGGRGQENEKPARQRHEPERPREPV